jgi:cytochrome c oxidase assembly protein subunit 15
MPRTRGIGTGKIGTRKIEAGVALNASLAHASVIEKNHDRDQQPADPGRWLPRFAWAVLAYNIAVILWGTVVRATGSGAGCGDRWPLCNGTVLPINPRVATVIEFTHRMMSGLTLVLVLALVVWVYRRTVRKHLARVAAVAAVLLTLNEALLGALLVKLGLTAQSTSPWRPPMLALHLANTLLLLGALALTAHFLARTGGAYRGAVAMRHLPLAVCGLAATLVVGVSGSLAALGDTLFPATSLRSALLADFSASAGWLIRLRVVHPASVVIAAAFILWLLWQAVFREKQSGHRALANALIGLLALQVALGVLDVLLRAPLWLQVLHLLGADVFWSVLVVLTARISILPRAAALSC